MKCEKHPEETTQLFTRTLKKSIWQQYIETVICTQCFIEEILEESKKLFVPKDNNIQHCSIHKDYPLLKKWENGTFIEECHLCLRERIEKLKADKINHDALWREKEEKEEKERYPLPTVRPRVGYSYKTRIGKIAKNCRLKLPESDRNSQYNFVLKTDGNENQYTITGHYWIGMIHDLDLIEELPLEPKPFDPTKPVQQRDGLPARIICTDSTVKFYNGKSRPIIALTQNTDAEEEIASFLENGHFEIEDQETGYDLINIEE